MNTQVKSKQPYIPLYIGDWDRDTNCLSLEAEGALLKLVFKLWDSDDRGKSEFSFNQLSILLKKSEEITRKIIAELHENNTLNVVFVGKDRVKFESRRMLKEIAKSLIYSENGSKGGRPKKANQKQTKSKLKPKQKLIPDNDNDIEYDNITSTIPNNWDKIEFEILLKKWVKKRKKKPDTDLVILRVSELIQKHPDWTTAKKALTEASAEGWMKLVYVNQSLPSKEQTEGRYAHERVTIFDKA